MTKENHQITAFAFAKTKAEKAQAAFQAQIKQEEEYRHRRIVLEEMAVGIPTKQLHEYQLAKKPLKRKWKWNTRSDKFGCPKCLRMDGALLTDKDIEKIRPPLHGKDEEHETACRCFLTEIK